MKNKIETWQPFKEYHVGDRFRYEDDPRAIVVVPADTDYDGCCGIFKGRHRYCMFDSYGCEAILCYKASRASKDDVCFVYESDTVSTLIADLKAAKGVIKSACKQNRLESPQGCGYLKSLSGGCAKCRIGNLVKRVEKHLEQLDGH